MKKLLSLILSLVMILSLSVSAFAASDLDKAADVKGTYNADTTGGVVYSVDITWSDLSFTYNAAVKGTWNPETHTYEGAQEAGWADGNGTITVTNHSNAAITAASAYTAAAGYESASMTFDNTALEIASAEATHAAVVGTITVTPGGTLPENTNDAVIGTITISIN